MPETKKYRRSTGKDFVNIILLLFSIAAIAALWPAEKRDSLAELTGSLLIISSCFVMLYLFLANFRPEILDVNRKTLFIFLTIIIFIVLTRIVVSFTDGKLLWLVPYAIIPIVMSTFFDARVALFILTITLMLAGFIVPAPFEFVFTTFIAGVTAIFSIASISRKGKILFSSIAVVSSYCIIHFANSIMNDGTISGFNLSDYELFAGNGALILLSYPLIFLFESRFYFLSDTTLLELSSTSCPLLRRFAEEAPGSFQHSLQVANLAEEAARVTGGNPLLARAGSLYHDIGKIVNSEYFIENQPAGSNPHLDLDPVTSSELIINHVNEGVLIARKYKLPVQIIDFIRTHHGTTRTYYFYLKYLKDNKPEHDLEKMFIYPGPKPFNRETAIVMMADAVEAASRTLDRYNEDSVGELIEKIFSVQEKEEQFADAPLTFRDISEIKTIFRKRLLTIHHIRTAYPERGNS
jgi:putative nucleotidyltransferase with HDIG domain